MFIPSRLMRIVAFGVLGLAYNVWTAWNIFLPGAATGRNDFISFYSGGSLAGTADLYDSPKVREFQLSIVGLTGDSQVYNRIPFFAFLLKAVTWLPYQRAYLLWEMLSAVAIIAGVALWPGPAPHKKWLAACWLLPVYLALFNGQDVTFVWFWIALSARFLHRKWPYLAGLALSLAASKYHLLIMIPIVVLAQKRWRFAAGVTTGIGILLSSSFGIAGLDWPRRYLAVLRDPRLVTDMSQMPGLYGSFHYMPGGLYLQAAAMILSVWVVFQISRCDATFERPLAYALLAGILASPHTWLADCILLLPVLMPASEPPDLSIRFCSLALITPVPWFLLQLPAPMPMLTRGLILALLLAQLASLRRLGGPSGALRRIEADS